MARKASPARLVIALSLGAMAVAAYDVARQLFNAPAGLVAAVVLVTAALVALRRRWPGVTSPLLYMTCRAFMRRNEDLPGFRYTSSCPLCLMHALEEITNQRPSP